MKTYKTPLSIRGDCLYCPLPFSLDSYWNCLVDCHHCYFRRLNHTWGTDLRLTDPMVVKKQLENGLKNTNPKSFLSQCMAKKKTIRFGNKSDPLQPIEDKYKITLKLIRVLNYLSWSYVIQTRFTERLMNYEKWLLQSSKAGLLTIMPVVSPGFEKDWSILEKGITTPPIERLRHSRYFIKKGVNVGINGEPFIPGFHTVSDFERTIRKLKAYGIKSYNTYNFHFNAFVAKRLHAIGIDIEKIWYYNQDAQWKPILQKLLDISKKHGIILGCPDFVNTGPEWREERNTCCGVQVPNPCTYNTHYWKHYAQGGQMDIDQIEDFTWDGIGDRKVARDILEGNPCDLYTLKDAGIKL